MTTGVEVDQRISDSEDEEYSDVEDDENELEEEEELSESDEGEDDDGANVESLESANASKNSEGPEEPEEISGWADSIARILKSNKPKNKKELMLSRARKDYEINKTAPGSTKDSKGKKRVHQGHDDLEIVPSGLPKHKAEDEEEIKEEKPSPDDNILSLKVQRKLELKQKKLELAWENLSRLNAEKTDPEVERDLLKIATKGVVQLFNAISMQQKTLKTKLRSTKKSEFKKDKVLAETEDMFNDAMSKSKSGGRNPKKEIDDDTEIKEESSSEDEMTGGVTIRKRKTAGSSSDDKKKFTKKKPKWNALQDDFMLDAKLKDWDKESDSD